MGQEQVCSVPLGFRERGTQFPLDLRLARAHGDFGDAGLWNQFEFSKRLSQRSDKWNMKQLDWEQPSLSHLVATGILEAKAIDMQKKPSLQLQPARILTPPTS